MLDPSRFDALWSRLGGKGDASSLFWQLLAAYSESHRAYHNTLHIADCLKQFDGARTLAERPDEVEAALWFHDAVYDPRASDNEERSAAWAEQALRQAGVDSDRVKRIVALILATKHNVEPHSRDCELLLDIDLSILGREPEVFEEYDRAIRKEYDWVRDESYRAGRVKVLRSFLDRPVIYRTELFRRQFEARARRNLLNRI